MAEKGRKKEINWKQNLLFTWIAQLLCLAGFGSALPFIPVFMRVKLGIEDPALRGVYVSIFYFASMTSFCICTPLWGMLSDRYGRKIMLLRANFGGALLMPLMGISPNIAILIILRFLTSCFSGTVTAAQTLIVSTTPKEKHGFALGLLSSAVWSGNVLGYLTGGMIVHYFGYTAAFLFCGLMFLAGGFLILFFVHEDFVPPVKNIPLPAEKKEKKHFKLPHFGFSAAAWMTLTLFLMMAFSRRFDEAYLALQVENIAGKINTELYTSYVSAAAAAGGVIAGSLIGYLADRFSPIKVALPCLLLSILFVLGQGFAPNLMVLGVSRFLAFITVGGLEPVFLNMLSNVSPEEKRGQIFGMASSFRSIGMMIASPLGGAIMYYLEIRSIYITAAAGFLLTIPVFLLTSKLCRKAHNEMIQKISTI